MSGLTAGILGASGYGGAGLIQRLMHHPEVDALALGSRQYLGQALGACWPQLQGLLPGAVFEDTDSVIERSQVLFCATPHGATAPLVARALAAGKRVIDLSADFRLAPATYALWYGAEHPHPELYEQARYGLVELHRDELAGAQLVASPGCNATSGSLALAPLAAASLLGESVVVNVLTGVSGAGRSPGEAFTYAELNDNAKAYKPGGTHRHTAEMEATAGRAIAAAAAGNGKALRTHHPFEGQRVSFTPHLVPMSRGILATCSVKVPDTANVTPDSLHELLADYYAGDPLVVVQRELPQTKAVAGSDRALLSAHYDERSRHALVFCALDNLGKGAAGQAVQGFNVAFGFPETQGLAQAGMWP
ncbi:MAG: N-acetyl-gamma-glutamyl-phosphate reductase [Trueperaceae bacterium]